MPALQAENVLTSFLFVGDLNGHHQEWLGSTTTNRHSFVAFDFASVSGCDQLVVGPSHTRGGTLDLMMNDVPDLIRVAAESSVFLKHQVNWNTVCGAIMICPGVTYRLLTILLRCRTNICPCWLDVICTD